ncbi:Uncharacterised protein [Mycobacteroides abscessus subsp. abscessus]|nr:Uncharacterised protein [Mycobacteroides abscessus subsp. abscessus]
MLVRSISGNPSNWPPTLPPLARNSAMLASLNDCSVPDGSLIVISIRWIDWVHLCQWH